MDLLKGRRLKKTYSVKANDTALNVGSGGFKVLATPTLVIWVENLAFTFLENYLDSSESSVGIYFEIDHIAPSAVGDEIVLELEVLEQEKKTITFGFKAFADKELAHGIHKRVIVDSERFLSKLN